MKGSKKKKLVMVCLAVLLVFCSAFLGGCKSCEKEKEWWEDKSKILFEFTGANGDVRKYYASEYFLVGEIVFEDKYSGYVFEPGCIVTVDGVERGYIKKGSIRMEYDKELDKFVNTSEYFSYYGKYLLSYDLYVDNRSVGAQFITSFTLTIIIY